MPSFRGNAGNLLQHWVLCELLDACASSYERLGFVDAYSMAPLATDRHPRRDASSDLFDFVMRSLPGLNSLYERAWLKLTTTLDSYPNSAAFVTATWRNRFALFLCESDSETVASLHRWARVARQLPGCEGVEIADGDWRNYLHSNVLPSSDLLFLSFDPYMFDRNGSGRNRGNMNLEDLDHLSTFLNRVTSPLVLQLSTYSANNDNAQEAVAQVVTAMLNQAGVVEAARIRVDGNMMSLVLTRDFQQQPRLQQLPLRFSEWLTSVSGMVP
jgi:hypothetical protein